MAAASFRDSEKKIISREKSKKKVSRRVLTAAAVSIFRLSMKKQSHIFTPNLIWKSMSELHISMNVF
jgi:hypothetical protein